MTLPIWCGKLKFNRSIDRSIGVPEQKPTQNAKRQEPNPIFSLNPTHAPPSELVGRICNPPRSKNTLVKVDKARGDGGVCRSQAGGVVGVLIAGAGAVEERAESFVLWLVSKDLLG